MKNIKLVLLDRDGVINHDSPDYILTPEQWKPISGSLHAIARLKKAGLSTAVCSNQSALGRGMITQSRFDAIQNKMVAAVQQAGGDFDHLAYCPHTPDDGCACRKPQAGLLHQAIQAIDSNLYLDAVVMIGDSLRDIAAAKQAGIKSMLVATGYGDASAIFNQAKQLEPNIQMCADLSACVDYILGEVL